MGLRPGRRSGSLGGCALAGPGGAWAARRAAAAAGSAKLAPQVRHRLLALFGLEPRGPLFIGHALDLVAVLFGKPGEDALHQLGALLGGEVAASAAFTGSALTTRDGPRGRPAGGGTIGGW